MDLILCALSERAALKVHGSRRCVCTLVGGRPLALSLARRCQLGVAIWPTLVCRLGTDALGILKTWTFRPCG
jgi:hypothetical protein